MTKEQLEYFAKLITNHSLSLKKGERVLIDIVGKPDEFIKVLVDYIYKAGAEPIIQYLPVSLLKSLIKGANSDQLEFLAKHQMDLLESVDAYLGIREEENSFEFEDLSEEVYQLYVNKYVKPVQMKALGLERWLLHKLPTAGMAQQAKLSTEALDQLFFDSINMNYEEFSKSVKPLADLLSVTDKVRIVSPGTDLEFSIKGIPNFICDGKFNLPDGEIFTAPIVDSVEGVITFNVPTSFLGKLYSDVKLEFSKGKLMKVSGNRKDDLVDLLSTDEGASRVGEFGIGLNPYIQQPTNHLCFDEKMAGSIHLAMGQCFYYASNGNESSIHIDFVLCQSKSLGGGELYFDGRLIRKDGMYVTSELKHLNTGLRRD